MKQKNLLNILLLVVLTVGATFVLSSGLLMASPSPRPAAQTALGTAFTYQGYLAQGGTPLDGQAQCDGQFGLWDAAAGGSQFGAAQTVLNIDFDAGYFAVELNGGNEFGTTPFTGEARWLEIAVRCPAGSGAYTTMGRQALTAAPYAQYSLDTKTNATTISSDMTLDYGQKGVILVTGNTTVTLPGAATAGAGTAYTIKNVDTAGNAVTIGGTADGRSNPSLGGENESLSIVSDGAAWRITGHYRVPAIILYDAGVATGGNLGGRAGADNTCQTSANRPAGRLNVRAFISVDANDEVRDMPANYGVPTNVPIQSLRGTGIANDWADLLDASIPVTLENAGVTSDFWWSGSQADGSLFPNDADCLNWTSADMFEAGWAGFWNATDLDWMDGQALGCGYPGRLLCLGY